jgi:hypothetical protein
MNNEKQSMWKKAEKAKVKFSLFLPRRQIGRGRDIVPVILNLGTKWRLVVRFTLRSLYFQGRTSVPIVQEAGWVPEPESIFCKREIFLAPEGFEPRTI